MKLLKGFTTGAIALALSITSFTASAQTMELYVGNQYLERDIVTCSDIDMLPIADIAGELGFTYSENMYGFTLYNNNTSFSFVMGSPIVYRNNQPHIELDIVPMVIDGKVRLPSTFITRNLGMSYVWDDITNTIFINSTSALLDMQSLYWYQGYKRAAEGRVATYRGSSVPDYGNLSGEEPIYHDVSDGNDVFIYDYYESDFNTYIQYLENTGWSFVDEYYDDIWGLSYYKDNMVIFVGVDYENDMTFAVVSYGMI